MKKIITFLSVILMVASCKQDGIEENLENPNNIDKPKPKPDNPDNFIKRLDYEVEVKTEDDFEGISLKNTKVVLINKETQKKYNASTDENGKVVIELEPGVYSIQASTVISAQEMKKVTSFEQETTFSAIAEEVIINKSAKAATTLMMKSGRLGDLVIKQIYHSGSGYKAGASSRDQFFEIHNNSNETMYLDGLCFAQIYGFSRKKDGHGFLSNGGFDWTKSMSGLADLGDKANTDFCYADEVISFPGNGKDYAIESGKSVIVAASAMNHKQPLVATDYSGKPKTYEVKNPSLTVDLSAAKFEVYYGNYAGVPKKDSKDIDSPSATDMQILYKASSTKEFLMSVTGNDAFVLFRADKTTIDSWRTAFAPDKKKESKFTKKYLQIPNSVVIDAVELNNINGEKPKRLSSSLDSGFVSPVKGSGTSESAIRKVAKTVNGRIIYQDTNNSTNDFEVIPMPNIEALN